jgi:P-type Cu+ transporter
VPAIARCDQTKKAERAHLATDPVCGMSVDPATAEHRREHRGRTYWFCSAHCARRFEASPEDYLTGERPQA